MPRRRKLKREQGPGDPVIINKIKHFVHLDGHDLSNIRIELDRLALYLIKECNKLLS